MRIDRVESSPSSALSLEWQKVIDHQKSIAGSRSNWIKANENYYREVLRALRFVIEEGSSVCEHRCDSGYFIRNLRTARGVGVDLSEEMIAAARSESDESGDHTEFVAGRPDTYFSREPFDYVLVRNLEDIVDIQRSLAQIRKCLKDRGRLVLVSYNRLWEPLVRFAEKIKFKVPALRNNWLSEADMEVFLQVSGFELMKTRRIVLSPYGLLGIGTLLNRFVARFPLINRLCMVRVYIARPIVAPVDPDSVSVSVVIPCRNEAGNIEGAVERMPSFGKDVELIFCDDKSADSTKDEIHDVIARYPEKKIRYLEGPGICKSKNVWAGFEAARGDVLMILDADLTVEPEDLPLFLSVLTRGVGDFVNGSRLVYPMDEEAMKVGNMIGNIAFSAAFSFVLGQRVGDSLCGTKVIWRADWPRVRKYIGTWGTEDRWGDFDLLFSAAKLNLKIVDLPVHYRERVHGTTKMTQVLRNGLRMARMTWFAARKFRLAY